MKKDETKKYKKITKENAIKIVEILDKVLKVNDLFIHKIMLTLRSALYFFLGQTEKEKILLQTWNKWLMRVGSPMCKCDINQICKKYPPKS